MRINIEQESSTDGQYATHNSDESSARYHPRNGRAAWHEGTRHSREARVQDQHTQGALFPGQNQPRPPGSRHGRPNSDERSIRLNKAALTLLHDRAAAVGKSEATLARELIEAIARDDLYDAVLDVD